MNLLTNFYLFRAIILFIALVITSGCHRATIPLEEERHSSPSLPYHVAGVKDKDQEKITKRLQSQGVRIVTMGQDYLLSLPSDRLFSEQSPHIMWRSYALLNDVVCYLKLFQKVGVNVSAFSSKYVSPARERALTAARARAVADYLWSQHIDSRFVFTRGLGSDKPILANEDGADNSPNSRIEITFRNIVA